MTTQRSDEAANQFLEQHSEAKGEKHTGSLDGCGTCIASFVSFAFLLFWLFLNYSSSVAVSNQAHVIIRVCPLPPSSFYCRRPVFTDSFFHLQTNNRRKGGDRLFFPSWGGRPSCKGGRPVSMLISPRSHIHPHHEQVSGHSRRYSTTPFNGRVNCMHAI